MSITAIQKTHSKDENKTNEEENEFDEIKMYLDCRYILVCEAT